MSDNPTCASCRWWWRYEGKWSPEGWCKRHAPAAPTVGTQPPAIWPMTDSNDYCGEHQDKGEG